VIGTYAAVLAVSGASLAIGQAAIALCGARRWSWLAPAVGLALLCVVCWGTVRLAGHGVGSALVVLVLIVASVAYLRGRLEGGAEALRAGWPVALIALLAASLPFAVEGHFGILGTGFNPDMSQHLLAADRLVHGEGSQLLHQGYPLGPHAIVVALNKGLGIGLVQGFSGLTVAVAILAPLTALSAFANLKPIPRTAAALVVGLAYVVASYFAQGAFKETMQALFVLAFVLALRESTRTWRDLPLRFVPAALLAAGSVYTYSFPGLIWLIGTATIWGLVEFAVRWGGSSAGGGAAGVPRGAEAAPPPSTVGDAAPTGPADTGLGPLPVRAALLALLTFFVLIAPEIGRMLDFHSFETFDPNGPGLGNLFGQVSPLEALGIWPSGDFRLAPGDGAVPAVGYYLGAAFALALLIYGVARCWHRRESAVLAGLGAVVLAYAAARTGGTPYTAAKAIEVGASVVALVILLPLLDRSARRGSADMRQGAAMPRPAAIAATLFLAAAGACSLLALANAPVGPTSYSSTLSDFRKLVGAGPTVVLVSPHLLDEQHGAPYLAWELRGGRVCIRSRDEAGTLPPGTRFVITDDAQVGEGQSRAVIVPPGFESPRGPGRRSPMFPAEIRSSYALLVVRDSPPGKSPCPLIAERQARQGPAR